MFTPTTLPANRPFPSEAIDTAFATFRRAYPAYDSTAKLDKIRATNFADVYKYLHFAQSFTGSNANFAR